MDYVEWTECVWQAVSDWSAEAEDARRGKEFNYQSISQKLGLDPNPFAQHDDEAYTSWDAIASALHDLEGIGLLKVTVEYVTHKQYTLTSEGQRHLGKPLRERWQALTSNLALSSDEGLFLKAAAASGEISHETHVCPQKMTSSEVFDTLNWSTEEMKDITYLTEKSHSLVDSLRSAGLIDNVEVSNAPGWGNYFNSQVFNLTYKGYVCATREGEILPRAVVVTALPLEYQAVCDHLTDIRETVHPRGTIYSRGRFAVGGRAWDVTVVEAGAGNASTAVETERAIERFDPKVVFFVGVAGGLKDVAIGDVVVATKVYGYHSGKAARQFETRPEVGHGTYRMEQRAKAEARMTRWQQRIKGPRSKDAPRVMLGPLAAGEQVTTSKEAPTVKLLRRSYSDTVAVEMEGHGFLKAAHANQQVDALVVRGISDLIEGKSEADKAGSQETAARHAAAFAFEVLAHLLQDE